MSAERPGDRALMAMALDAARRSQERSEIPVGAAIADAKGEILSVAGNAPISDCDPTAHAEIRALREAARRVGNYRLPGAQLFVTLEPCAMCAGAISLARIARLVIAAEDPKGGAVWHGPKFFEQPTCHWRPEIVRGPFALEAGAMLREFFKQRRR